MQVGAALLCIDGCVTDVPRDLLAAVPGCRALENGEVRGLGLVRDDGASAVRHGVGGVVALVAPDVEHDRAFVVGRVRFVRRR